MSNSLTPILIGEINWTEDEHGKPLEILEEGLIVISRQKIAVDDKEDYWFHFEFTKKVFVQTVEKENFEKISLRGKLVPKGETTQAGKSKRYKYKFIWKEGTLKSTKIHRWTEFKEIVGKGGKIRLTWHDKNSNVRYCGCKEVSENWKPKGEIVVYHTFFLPDFFKDASETALGAEEQMNLSRELTDFYLLKATELGGSNLVSIQDRENRLIEDGDDFSVFKYRLHNDGKYPVENDGKKFVDLPNPRWLVDKAYRSSKGVKKTNWNGKSLSKASIKIRLNRNHVIDVVERIPITPCYIKKKKDAADSEINIKGLVKFLLRFRHPGVKGNNPNTVEPGDTEAIKLIAFDLVKELYSQWKIEEQKKQDKSLWNWRRNEVTLKTPDPNNVKRQRQRYVVVLLDEVRCDIHPTMAISPKVLGDSPYMENLMDGTLNFEHSPRRSDMPSIREFEKDERNDNQQINFATWENELCVFGPERAVIYYTPQTVMFSRRRIADYKDYWHCILRGIGLAVTIKTVLHLLETHSAKATRDVPELSRRAFNRDKAFRLAERVGYIQLYLPWVREVSLASSAFRESQVIKKFDFLFEECFRFSSIVSHIQQNVDELSGFMQYLKGRELTINTTRIAAFFSVMGLLLAALATFYALPGFVDAASKFCSGGCFSFNDSGFAAIFLGAFLIVHLVGTVYYLLIHRKHFKNDLDMKSGILIWGSPAVFLGILIIFGAVSYKYYQNKDVTRPVTPVPVFEQQPNPTTE